MSDQHGDTPFALTDPSGHAAGPAAIAAAPATSPREQTAQEWALEQRALTQLGLHELRQRWEQQPDMHVLTVGENQQADQTIPGFPESAFHGLAVLNNTGHTLRVSFGTSSAAGAPLLVPPKSFLVWPAEYANVTINSDTTRPAEQVVLLRLRYPPAQPALEILPEGGPRETWSEEENGTGATVTLKVAGKPGRKIVVTSVIAMMTATGAVAANAILQGSIKSGGTTIFRFNLNQTKTTGAGEGGSQFVSGPINLTLREGESLTIEVTGAEANANVIVNASGYFQ